MSKNNNIHKVYYSAFNMTKEIQDYFNKLSMLVKLNLLLDKKLINNSEYEKIKESLGFLHTNI